MVYPDSEYPERIATAWRIVTRTGDYTVICKEEDLIRFQREYIQEQQARGIDLRDIVFMWDRTRIVPLSAVR